MQPFQRLAQDSEGNVYVTGRAYLPGTGHVALIVKYLRNGTEAWSRTYQSATNAADAVYRLTIDQRGELSAIISTVKEGRSSASVLKLDREGNFISVWERPWLLTAAAADADGSIFVSGFLWNDNGGLDNVLAKYDASGLLVWDRLAAFPHPETGAAHVLAIDRGGNVYAAGSEISILKYDRDGRHLWAANYFGKHSMGMAMDKSDNIYVIGWRHEDDTLTVKLDTNGREVWRSTYRDPRAGETQPLDIAVNGKGEAHVVTKSRSFYNVIKYSVSGAVIWRKEELGAPFSGHARLVVNPQGEVWLWMTTPNDDALLVHYDRAARRRAHRYQTGPSGLEWAADILVGGRGQIAFTYYSIDQAGPAWVTRMLRQ